MIDGAGSAARQTLASVFVLAAVIGILYLALKWTNLAASETPTMKHFLVLVIMTLLGTIGATYHPFWGLLLYYGLAVLRPQHLWEWSLPVEWRWSLIAAAVAIGAVAINFHRVMAKARMNLVMWLMLVYAILLMLSALVAYDPATAQRYGEEYGKIFVMAMIAGLVVTSFWQIKALTLMVLLALGYVAWEVNSLYLFQGRLDIFHYGYGGLDNNGAGLMLAMGLPFAYAYGITSRARWCRAASWLLGLFMLHAILMSYSRGAMVAAVFGAGWLLWRHRSRTQKVVIAALLAMAVSVLAGQEIRSRFLSTGQYTLDDSARARLDSWGAAWQIALDHPLTGQGIRNSNRYTENYGADRHGRAVHSQYLQIAADSGLPAMFCYIGLFGAAVLMLGRSRNMCLAYLDRGGTDDSDSAMRKTDELRQASAVLLACQASLLIFGFGGVFLSLEVFELPWLMIMLGGVSVGAIHRQLDQPTAPEADPAAPNGDPHDRPRRRTARPLPTPTLATRQGGGLI